MEGGTAVELLAIRHLTFAYPEQEKSAVSDFSLSVRRGEFLVICGPSGCGKSTLLRQLKPALAPHGRRGGEILFENTPLERLSRREQAEKIGFVQQNPDNQIVTDKVWHELAFGLESLGCDTPVIRRRVAEMASFFGIQTWFHKRVEELSGGQKQLLNLASVMVMQPEILILDEPASQLDPIAAADFLAVLGRINRELGTTVILTEHCLEEAFSHASRAAVMDGGRLVCVGSPAETGAALKRAGSPMFLAMPAAMRIWAAVDGAGSCPVSVRDGREWLLDYSRRHELRPVPEEKDVRPRTETVMSARELWFRYDRDLPDVVRGLSLELRRGEFFALLGGNGTGKTTALKLLAGLRGLGRGELRTTGSVGMLPQDPRTLFVRPTVYEDLMEALPKAERTDGRIAEAVSLCRLTDLLGRHPYDLSGGEQQRAALAKVLLQKPDILLLDEPTKGLDAEFRQSLGRILRTLRDSGTAILMVSHDIEFCARYADRCALFFDGSIVNEAPPRAFFSGNSFYTTAANRISRGLLPGAVTPEDVIRSCGGKPLPEPDLPPCGQTLTAPERRRAAAEKLPVWRRVLAAASGLVSLFLIIQAVGITDLTKLVDAGGVTALSGGQLRSYAVLIAALFVFALSVSQRGKEPHGPLRTPEETRKLRKRTLAATLLILILVPLTLFAGIRCFGGRRYYFTSLLILLECMAPFFIAFEGRRPQARELVLIAVLVALNVAGRAAFFMLPEFKPVVAMTILSGTAFGGETGFLVGAATMLVSNMLFSQGPWTPWQMFAMGIIGWLAGVCYRKGMLRRGRLSLCVFGAICSTVIYGGIMNPASALMWSSELNWGVILSCYLTGIPVDLVRAAGTVFFLWVGAEPMLEKLDRVKVKYGLVE
jgi:energy-coupling factor transport system ATP-binding protein